MPDPISTTGERTVVVHRFGALTYLSLAFNALILLLILIGIIAHHSDKRPGGENAREEGRMGHHDWGDRDGGPREGGDREGGDRFHQGGFGGMHHGWHHGFGGPGGPGKECESCAMSGHDAEGGHPGWGGGEEHAGFGGPPMGGFGGDHAMPKTPPSAEEMTDRFMLMMTQKLTLTDAESAQIRPIAQSGIAQFQKDMETQKAAHQKMIDDAKTKVRAVLTPDQQKQFDEMTAKMGPPPVPATK